MFIFWDSPRYLGKVFYFFRGDVLYQSELSADFNHY